VSTGRRMNMPAVFTLREHFPEWPLTVSGLGGCTGF
jgi:hypothetical protein